MSQLTADVPAIVLGAGVGVTGAFYAHHTLRQAMADDESHGSFARTVPMWLLSAISGLSGALVGSRFGMQARLPAYLYLAAIAPVLAAVDAATRKLPDRILLPSFPVAVALLGFAAWRGYDAELLWRGVLAGALLFAVFLLLALVSPPGSLGLGDVKFVGLLGLFLGFLGWSTVWLGMMIAFGLAATYVGVRALTRCGPRNGMLPLGPALLVGTLLAVVVT
jgi:leader peptidase (prepilin peptidase)/N-methyltransferase